MSSYLALLRGINVSGKNMLKMPDLIKALGDNGFRDVESYIQSGNIVFSADELSCDSLARNIEELIQKRFGLAVPALVITLSDLTKVIKGNPFLKRSGIDIEKLHVTFLEKEPDHKSVEQLESMKYPPDELIVVGKASYLYCPEGYGRTKFNNTFIEKKLDVRATTRNWRTCIKMVESLSR